MEDGLFKLQTRGTIQLADVIYHRIEVGRANPMHPNNPPNCQNIISLNFTPKNKYLKHKKTSSCCRHPIMLHWLFGLFSASEMNPLPYQQNIPFTSVQTLTQCRCIRGLLLACTRKGCSYCKLAVKVPCSGVFPLLVTLAKSLDLIH